MQSQQAGSQARGRKVYEDAMDESLRRMHLPTRDDVVRMTRIATLLEERLLAQEDTLLQLSDELTATQKEVVLARIEAAEARIAHSAEVAALSAKLDALQQQLAQPAKAAPRRTRKPAAKPAADKS